MNYLPSILLGKAVGIWGYSFLCVMFYQKVGTLASSPDFRGKRKRDAGA